jgi:hypothetical protein
MGFRRTGGSPRSTCTSCRRTGRTVGFPDWPACGDTVSLLYQPDAMRWRGISVADQHAAAFGAARSRHNQTSCSRSSRSWTRLPGARNRPARDPAHQRAADRSKLRRQQGPPDELLHARSARYRCAPSSTGKRRARSGQRNGSKVTGVGVGRPIIRPAQRLRRPRPNHAGRQAAHPYRCRQSRHVLATRHLAHRGRGAEGYDWEQLS